MEYGRSTRSRDFQAVLPFTRKYTKTKFEGVFFRQSAKRDPRTGEYDKIYCFWYADHEGKGHWKTVGRHSKGVRPAKLAYRCLAQSSANGQPCSLVQVRLYTGRTHQIRVQFASRQLPLLGDIRYGCKDPLCDVALWSYRLGLRHPKTGQALAFCQPPPAAYPWSLFAGTITPDLPPLA